MEQIELNTKESGNREPDAVTVKFTGDPFVDIGGLVIETLRQQTLEDKIRFATDVYVDKWKGKLNSVFLNSKLNNVHVMGKPELQRKGALDYYLGFLDGKDSVSKGYCRICAKNGLLFDGDRTNYPMTGSGEFTNFHHFQ